MKAQLFLAHIGLFLPGNVVWGFMPLVLLIVFLALVASDSSKDKEK